MQPSSRLGSVGRWRLEWLRKFANRKRSENFRLQDRFLWLRGPKFSKDICTIPSRPRKFFAWLVEDRRYRSIR